MSGFKGNLLYFILNKNAVLAFLLSCNNIWLYFNFLEQRSSKLPQDLDLTLVIIHQSGFPIKYY